MDKDAFEAGFDAGVTGDYSGNPYPYDSEEYKSYERGFRSGEDNKSSWG